MEIDAKLVADLRRATGLPMMKCKQALVESKGDLDLAMENLRKGGLKAVEGVKDRALKEGLVFHHTEGSGACALSVLCNTDFVARSDDVRAFGSMLAKHLYTHAPTDRGAGDSLRSLKLPTGKTVDETITGLIQKTRENIAVGSYARFRPEKGHVFVYVHHNQRIASLIELEGKDLAKAAPIAELGNELGMQVAFHADVKALVRDELDPEWVAKEREIFLAQAAEMPEERRGKIAEGKLNKRLSEVVLLEQPFIKNDKETVRQHVDAVSKQAGVPAKLKRFARIGAGA